MSGNCASPRFNFATRHVARSDRFSPAAWWRQQLPWCHTVSFVQQNETSIHFKWRQNKQCFIAHPWALNTHWKQTMALRDLSKDRLKTRELQSPHYCRWSCALAGVSASISFQFETLNAKGPMHCNVICIKKRPNRRGWDAASNEVRACRQRLFYCELVASIHLSPLQSRHCDRVRCLKIPREGLCLLYGFVLVCGYKECLHTAGLAQGSFISWINDSFSWIFTTRLSDNHSLVGFLHSQQQLWWQTELLEKEITQEMLGPSITGKSSCFRPPYCQPDPANEFCLTISVPRVAAWHWSLSGLRGWWGCEMPSVVPLCFPFPSARTQQDRKSNNERSCQGAADDG